MGQKYQMRKCDLCGKENAYHIERVVVNNGLVEYSFCDQCFQQIKNSGLSAFEFMQKRLADNGKMCRACGSTVKDFQHSFLFGCPDCYIEMRKVAEFALFSAQGAIRHKGKGIKTK